MPSTFLIINRVTQDVATRLTTATTLLTSKVRFARDERSAEYEKRVVEYRQAHPEAPEEEAISYVESSMESAQTGETQGFDLSIRDRLVVLRDELQHMLNVADIYTKYTYEEFSKAVSARRLSNHLETPAESETFVKQKMVDEIGVALVGVQYNAGQVVNRINSFI